MFDHFVDTRNFIIKDTHREKAPSNKTLALTKTTLKFTKRPKTPGITFHFSCSSGWNKCWYVWIYKEMDYLTSRIILQKASSYKYQFWTKVCDGWAKYKEKVPDMSDSNQKLETICNSKLKFAELKDLFIKKAQKN